MRLGNKVALITGAANGIGLATAQLFAREGARVMLADVDRAGLEKAVGSIGPDKAAQVVVDVTSPESNKAMVDACVKRFGRIDVFVANAGIEGKIGSIAESSVENFDRVMAVNVRGVWLGLHYVIPEMKKRGGGSILITSSGAGVMGSPKLAPYNTSKHAAIGLMRCAALELAAENIRVNTVNPGMIGTRMAESIEEGFHPGAGDKFKAAIIQDTPIGRYGSPDEVAAMMLFLASDESSYCTGGVYMVDGGNST